MQQIRIDFDNPGLPQSLGVVEGESQSRLFQAALYKSGAAYTAPAGAVYSIMYRGFGPQNQGWYDTIEDGAGKRAACTVSGNVVTCELARQALRVPGHLTVVLCVSDTKGYMLKSWPIMADVRNDGYEDTGEIEMYFNLSGLAGNYLTQLEKAMADAETTKNNLISTSTQAQKDIDAKAAETLKTIPESYTELDGSVKQLKEDIGQFSTATYIVNIPLKQGGISSDGHETESDTVIRSITPIDVKPSESITLTDTTLEYRILGLYQGNLQVIKDYDEGNSFTFKLNKSGVRFTIRKKTQANIVPSEVDTGKVFKRTIAEILQKIINLNAEKVIPIIKEYEDGKYNPMNLTDVGYDHQNMIWSWWCYPQAVSRNNIRNQLYFGYTTNDGHSGVAQYNFATKEKKKTALKISDIDDHNAPCVFLSDIGKVIVAYSGGHNTDKQMHIRISKSLENIDAFENVINIDCGGRTTYAQMLYSTNYYYLFFRLDNVAWCYTRSSDLHKWATPVKLIDASNIQYYVRFVPTDNDSIIRMVMYSNPSEGHTEIRQGFINTYTGKVRNSDNVTELGTDTQTYSYTKFTVLIPITSGKENRLFDVAVESSRETTIAFCTFSTRDDSEYYVYKNGNTTKVTNGGNSFWIPKYQGGMSFITPTKLVLSRSNDGKDKIEIWELNENSWIRTESIYEANNFATQAYPLRNVRPIVDVNGKALLWHSGYYNSGDFSLFDTDAVIREIN